MLVETTVMELELVLVLMLLAAESANVLEYELAWEWVTNLVEEWVLNLVDALGLR